MPFKLLACDNDILSLEFEPDDMDVVRAAIVRQFGALAVDRRVISSEVHFGGESFTFQNEWDDPCLITSTDGGRAMLRRLYDDLVVSEARQAPGSSPG